MLWKMQTFIEFQDNFTYPSVSVTVYKYRQIKKVAVSNSESQDVSA